MTTIARCTDTVAGRQAALDTLNALVRSELTRAAARWRLGGEPELELTAYDQVYPRTPAIGGHWTLFSAHGDDARHEVAVVSVAVEFEAGRPVDLHVSGAANVVAGGCTAAALREALTECGGPLRQVTPLAGAFLPAAAIADFVLAATR